MHRNWIFALVGGLSLAVVSCLAGCNSGSAVENKMSTDKMAGDKMDGKMADKMAGDKMADKMDGKMADKMDSKMAPGK